MWSWSSRKSIQRSLCIDLFGSINLRNFSIYTCFHLGTCSQGLIFLRSEHWIRYFSRCAGSTSAFVRRHQLGFHLIWLCYRDSPTVSTRFVTAFSSATLEGAVSSFTCQASLFSPECRWKAGTNPVIALQQCGVAQCGLNSCPNKTQWPLDR